MSFTKISSHPNTAFQCFQGFSTDLSFSKQRPHFLQRKMPKVSVNPSMSFRIWNWSSFQQSINTLQSKICQNPCLTFSQRNCISLSRLTFNWGLLVVPSANFNGRVLIFVVPQKDIDDILFCSPFGKSGCHTFCRLPWLRQMPCMAFCAALAYFSPTQLSKRLCHVSRHADDTRFPTEMLVEFSLLGLGCP